MFLGGFDRAMERFSRTRVAVPELKRTTNLSRLFTSLKRVSAFLILFNRTIQTMERILAFLGPLSPLGPFLLSILVLVFAATFVVTFILNFAPTERNNAKLRIPGPAPSDDELGNLGDLAEAGSLHEYLARLHAQYGPVVAFRWGKNRVVSTASPEAWKPLSPLFDRPIGLFALFEPLIGRKSIQYANGKDGKARRKNYIDPAFNHAALGDALSSLHLIAGKAVQRWGEKMRAESGGGKQVKIVLQKECSRIALEAIILTAFGRLPDEEEIQKIGQAYEVCWHEMETRLGGSFPDKGDPRDKEYSENLDYLRKLAQSYYKEVAAPAKSSDKKPSFLDLLKAANVDEDQAVSEVITMLVGGFHTSGNLLTWALYCLAANKDVQERAAKEVIDVCGDVFAAEEISVGPSLQTLTGGKLPYLNAVVDETLRWSVLAPWAARESDKDVEVLEFKVPPATPIIQALGVVLQNREVFADPETFEPRRFLNSGAESPYPAYTPLAFSPFGFAGKRVCPGARYAEAEAAAVLARVLARFQVELVGREDVGKVYGLVTSPDREIEVVLRARV